MSEDKYNDPVKQLSREAQLAFERRHLGAVPRRDLSVVYLPGEMNYEWQIYKAQGALPENAVGLEDDAERFGVLQENAKGVPVEHCKYSDFFRRTGRKFHVISLDTEGQLTDELISTLDFIVRNELAAAPGVIVTNVYGQREAGTVKDNYILYEKTRKLRQMIEEREELFVDAGANRVEFNVEIPEVKEDPLKLRSDSIAESVVGCICGLNYSREMIETQIEFARKYFPGFESEMRDLVKKAFEDKIEAPVPAVVQFANGELSLEDAAEESITVRMNLRRFLDFKMQWATQSPEYAEAIQVAFFDPWFIAEHRSLQYTSKTRGKMYMDMVAVNRASKTDLGPIMEEFRKTLVMRDGMFWQEFYVNGNSPKRIKRFHRACTSRMMRLVDYAKDYIFQVLERACPEREELKLEEAVEEDAPVQVAVSAPEKGIRLWDVIPPKFYYRLPENYQLRLDTFVEQVSGVDAEMLAGVASSNWYRDELLDETEFYSFWDGVYLHALERPVEKDDMKRIWDESRHRRFLKSSAGKKIDKSHPGYEKERQAIIEMLDSGMPTAEIRKRKPNVKSGTISGIAAWHKHRDSWAKA